MVLRNLCIFLNIQNHTNTENCTSSYEQCGTLDCPFEERHHCFLVWNVTNSVVNYMSAGCHPPFNGATEECANECIGQSKGERYYCCCKNHLCNLKFKLPPPPQKLSGEKAETRNLSETQSTSTILWSIIPIIMVATFVFTFLYRHKRFKVHNDRHSRSIRVDSNDRELNEYCNNREISILTPFRNGSNDHGTGGVGADEFYMTDNNHLNNNHNFNHRSNLMQRTTLHHDANQINSSVLTAKQPIENRLNLSEVKLLEIIGSGRFGTVHKATAPINLDKDDTTSENTIAVKIISRQDYQSWLSEREIYNIPLIKHPNIINLLYSDEHLETESYWLVVEYASKGSLYKFLKENVIDWKELLHISLGIVHGLSHLHEINIVHRDFKSKNVLLRHDLTPCITDFGVATILDTLIGSQIDEHKKYLQVGTPRYMAPEILECCLLFTKASFTKVDVYALSLVLWELVSRCRLPTLHNKTEVSLQIHASKLDELQRQQQYDERQANNNSPPPHYLRSSTPLSSNVEDGGRESSNNKNVETASESTVEADEYAEDGSPPPYKMPFEEVAGHNPDINTMRQIVLDRKLRPTMRKQWKVYPINQICQAIQDGWEYDHDARISAFCFVERVESLAQSG